MKKSIIFSFLFTLLASYVLADVVLPTGMEILTPEGVTVTVGDTRAVDKAKNKKPLSSKLERFLYFLLCPFRGLACFFGGEGGIRTPGTLNEYVSLANWWFQPLTHLTKPLLLRRAKVNKYFYFAICSRMSVSAWMFFMR